MSWEVEYTLEFGAWWTSLDEAEQIAVAASVGLLERFGPALPFPHSSGVASSRYARMRELRIQHKGRPRRVLYAFDPRRVAILIERNQTMAEKFAKLRAQMSPAARRKAAARAEALTREMPLHELRAARKLSQEALAAALRTGQSSISRLEKRTDMYVSTLRSYVEALGGELEITARFRDGVVRISQFGEIGG